MAMPETRNLNEAQGGRLTDADRLRDCLCGAKERAVLYAQAALEATNNGVREFFLAMHGEETHNQEILFSFLHTRGYYPVSTAEPQRIQEAARRYREIHDSLGLTGTPTKRRYHTADPQWPPAWTVEKASDPNAAHP